MTSPRHRNPFFSLLLLSALLVLPACAGQDDDAPETPAPAAQAAAEPAAIEWTSLDELAAVLSENGDLPGVAIAWARLGEEPQVGVAGVRAADGSDPIQPGDAFHIGSITKSVTSTAIAALVERDELAWSDTLSELLADMEMNDVYRDMALERLVRHRAQIVQHSTFDGAEMSRLNGLPGDNTDQRATYVAEVLVAEPLEPGYAYSNAGYAMAGHIAERTAGVEWEELVVQEVFEPLGLDSCGIGWPANEENPDQPRGHYGDAGSRRAQRLDEYRLGAFMRPAGDVHCDVGDLARYGLAHLTGLSGEDGLLTAETVAELHRTDDVPYAAGWGVDPNSGQHRHNGSAGTFFSYLTIDPEAQIVVAFLTNAAPQSGQPAAQQAAAEILGRFAEQ